MDIKKILKDYKPRTPKDIMFEIEMACMGDAKREYVLLYYEEFKEILQKAIQSKIN